MAESPHYEKLLQPLNERRVEDRTVGGRERKAVRLPIIDSKRTGRLQLNNRKINEVLFP